MTPENQIMQQQLMQALQTIDVRHVTLLLTALGVRGAMPVTLSAGRAVNLDQVCLYEQVERMNVRTEFVTLRGKDLSDIDAALNAAKSEEHTEVLIVSELRFVGSEKNGQWVQQIEKVVSTPTGEQDQAIIMPDGQQVILSSEEDAIFRENWMTAAVVANEYLSSAAALFQPETIAAAGKTAAE